MARGAYDTTIKDEIRRYGGSAKVVVLVIVM